MTNFITTRWATDLIAVTAIAAGLVLMTAAAASSAPADQSRTAAGTEKSRPDRQPSPAQIQTRERQKACAGEWRRDKAAGRTAGQTWPRYWSDCNRRLKAARA